MGQVDRRKFPRVHDEDLSLELRLDDFDTVTHTLNISASGVYCKIPREIPLMSRVKIMLMIPTEMNGAPSINTLEVTGVVVREHPVVIEGETRHYDAAIFFDDLSPADREMIALYIARKKVS